MFPMDHRNFSQHQLSDNAALLSGTKRFIVRSSDLLFLCLQPHWLNHLSTTEDECFNFFLKTCKQRLNLYRILKEIRMQIKYYFMKIDQKFDKDYSSDSSLSVERAKYFFHPFFF